MRDHRDSRPHRRVADGASTAQAGVAPSFDQLHGLLESQAYRLAYWRTAFDEINYRRFFDVNDLAGLRMEDPRVFAATHALLLDLVERGHVTGIRIDHPDGLFDPTAYFESLARRVAEQRRDGRGHRRLRRRREDSRPRRAAARRLAGARHDRLRLPEHAQRPVRASATASATLRRLYREFTGNRTSAGRHRVRRASGS